MSEITWPVAILFSVCILCATSLARAWVEGWAQRLDTREAYLEEDDKQYVRDWLEAQNWNKE